MFVLFEVVLAQLVLIAIVVIATLTMTTNVKMLLPAEKQLSFTRGQELASWLTDCARELANADGERRTDLMDDVSAETVKT